MWPKQHAAVSVTFFSLYGLVFASSIPEGLLWLVVGTAAGVLIDIDHVLLGIVVGRHFEAIRWFRHPIHAMTKPGDLLDHIEYPRMVYDRTITHLLAITIAFVLVELPLMGIVFLALCLHLSCDLIYDIQQGVYPFGG